MKQRAMFTAALAALALSGTFEAQAIFGKKKAPLPAFDSTQPAATFIGIQREKHMAPLSKVALTACNVMFASSSGASASTSPELFGNVDNNRGEATVNVLYTLMGLEDADMQRMTDRICATAEQQLAGAGFDVVPHMALSEVAPYLALREAGRALPFEYKSGGTRYLVFGRSGDTLFDERYIGTASGLGQAFKAAGGDAAWQHEARIFEDTGASGLNLNILVDFVQVEGDGHDRGIANKNRAEVTSSVELSITGEFTVKPHAHLNCWDRFGKRECEVRAAKSPAFHTLAPITLPEPFYTAVRNTTTTGDKVSAGVTKALSLVVGTRSRSATRYEVDVTPEQFEQVATQAAGSFIEMAVTRMRPD